MSGWYGRKVLARRASRFGTALVEEASSSSSEASVGDDTTNGRMMEPAKEMIEKNTRAMEPRRAMSPTTSVEFRSSAAREGEAR